MTAYQSFIDFALRLLRVSHSLMIKPNNFVYILGYSYSSFSTLKSLKRTDEKHPHERPPHPMKAAMKTAWIILTLAPVTAAAIILALTRGDDTAVRFMAWVWRIPYNRDPFEGDAA